VDDATVDVLDVPPDKNSPTRSHSMYAVAAKSELVKNRQQLFTQAKTPLSVIDIPEMAQRNIAALLEPPGRGLAMLSFNNEGGLLTITQGGELYLARRIDISLEQLTSAGAEQKSALFEIISTVSSTMLPLPN
jgi:MSHA biogenesis protein MshI